jgi:uncharacterized protein (TIGR02246 family)
MAKFYNAFYGKLGCRSHEELLLVSLEYMSNRTPERTIRRMNASSSNTTLGANRVRPSKHELRRKALRPESILLTLIAVTLMVPLPALSEQREAEVRTAIQAFYKAFDEGFTGPAIYATEDWNHISPYGGRDHGRDATLKTVREVHQSFLKSTTDTIERMDIRFATLDVAVGTVVSVMSPFTSPDGVKHGLERHIRTFVVVKRDDRWRIMQDQNTTIVEAH